MTSDNNYVIYDIESYPNIFTICISDVNFEKVVTYEISPRRNDFKLILKALLILKQSGVTMTGFNNINYDYPVIHDLLTNATSETGSMDGEELAYSIFLKSDSIIQSKFGTYTAIYPSQVLIKQLDLLKVNHFDNQNRRTSLKCLEFKMRSMRIQDLPFKPGEPIPEESMDDLRKYNEFDVYETCEFFKLCKDKVSMREELLPVLGPAVMNYNDSKIGESYMINRLESELGPDICYSKIGNKRTPKQTKRSEIVLNEVLDSRVQFVTEPFKAIHTWVKGKVITETKGVFKDIDLLEDSSQALLPYIDEISKVITEESKGRTGVKKVSKSTQIKLIETGEVLYTYRGNGSEKKINDIRSAYTPDQISFEVVKHTCPKLAIPFNNLSGQHGIGDILLVYGLGGLHGSVRNKHIRSDEDWVIIDADVKGYYPNTMISIGAYPEHLTEHFLTIFKGMVDERDQYAKGTPENARLKLSSNSVYGKSNDKFSPLYDPKCTMQITLNGQLFLSMLIERLKLEIGDDVQLIQANTDGITVLIKRTKANEFISVCNNWCKLTNLVLEYDAYNHMYIKDVNNYLAVKQNGKTKAVGAYADPVPSDENFKGDWAKNHNELIVYKTAVKKILNPNLDVEQELRNHPDLFDFMAYLKGGGRSFKRLATTPEGEVNPDLNTATTIQSRSRFLVTTEGVNLYQVYESSGESGERSVAARKGRLVTVCNDLEEGDLENLKNILDYDYYIEEINKLLNLEEVK